MRRTKPMRVPFVSSICLLACLSVAPAQAWAQDSSSEALRAKEDVPAPAERSLLQTIAGDLKSVASKESVSVLSAATAFALFASPFDDNLTYSASCSTFLKTTFEPWARVAGQEWLLGSGALATYAIGRAFDRPRVAAIGGDLIEAQIVAGVIDVRVEARDPAHAAGRRAAIVSVRTRLGNICRGHGGAAPFRSQGRDSRLHRRGSDHRRAHAGELALPDRSDHGRGCWAYSPVAPRRSSLDRTRVQLSPTATPGGVAVTGTIQ